MNRLRKIFASIRSRLYFGFFLLVSLFILNGIITLYILDKNKQLSNRIRTVIDPTSYTLKEFRQIIIESKMLSANWVFMRSNKEDKEALLFIHRQRYPAAIAQLNELTPQLFNKQVNDSLQKMYAGIDRLLSVQKDIIQKLNSFESYDDRLLKMEMELQVEEEVIPQTAALLSTMNYVMAAEKKVREDAIFEVMQFSDLLRNILIVLAFLVVAIGILFSIYLVRIITSPIHKMVCIITQMGNGKLSTIDNTYHSQEIDQMVNSVNRLSINLKASADFALEIGHKNFNVPFTPLSNDDILGKSLVAMRDNLQKSNFRLNQAQTIAKMGSWEFNPVTGETIWSDELFKILGYRPGEIEPRLRTFMDQVVEEDRERLKIYLNRGMSTSLFQFECRILTHENVFKEIIIQWQAEFDAHGDVENVVGIVQDVTFQKLAEERQKNLAELQKINKELDKFVYSVSHDLRAPLSSMLGIVQIIEEDCNDAMIKDSLGMVKGSILKLDGFINDILNYSRNARVEVKKDEIKFDALIHEITGNLKYMEGADESVKIFADIEQKGRFLSDQSRLTIVLSNLIANAIRYRNQNSTEPFVRINVNVASDEATIVISDNGVGIRNEHQERIFEMFYRVSENSVGSGLGLYIVKETISVLEGEILIDSKINIGTCFTIKIPNRT